MGKGIEVITSTEFEQFQKSIQAELLQIRQQLDFYTSVIPAEVDRRTAMQILKVKDTKLWQLTRAGQIQVSYRGRSPKYSIESIRQYINNRTVGESDPQKKIQKFLAFFL